MNEESKMNEETNVRNGLVSLEKPDERDAKIADLEVQLAEVIAARETLTRELQASFDHALIATQKLTAIDAVLKKHVPHLRNDERTGWLLAEDVRAALGPT